MSDFWLTPAVPGTVAPTHLDKVRELHVIVRGWIEASAREQKNEHINVNLPYVDLMFAFGFATLGDHATASKLVEDARKVMEGPIPNSEGAWANQAEIKAIVRNFLFKLFEYRIGQLFTGQRHVRAISGIVRDAYEGIRRKGGQGPVNNPYNLAVFTIDRFRSLYVIVEPEEHIDPYAVWKGHHSALEQELAQLKGVSNPQLLEARVRKLFWDGIPEWNLAEVQFFALLESLSLADRFSRVFLEELLDWVPGTLMLGCGSAARPLTPYRQAEMWDRAVVLAAHLGRNDLVAKVCNSLLEAMQRKTEEERLVLASAVMPGCVYRLKLLGLRQEIDRLLPALDNAVLGNVPLSEWRLRYWNQPERWAAVLRAAMRLVPGWWYLGDKERVRSVLTEARIELVNANSSPQSLHYTEVARSYVRALGEGIGEGLDSIKEFFALLQPGIITNTHITAQFYSRLHLQIVEDAVLAACRFCLENSVPVNVNT